MSDAFIQTNVRLSLEFDKYLASHPDLYNLIPSGAYIFITTSDKKFNKDSESLVSRYSKKKKIVEAHKVRESWDIRPYSFAVAQHSR